MDANLIERIKIPYEIQVGRRHGLFENKFKIIDFNRTLDRTKIKKFVLKN